MSDDNLTNLEDDAPAPAAPELPPTEPPADAAPAPVPPPEGEKPAEVESVEVGGQKYVPLSVLKAERDKRQQLQPLAQRAQELEQWAQQNRPYIEFLQANPDFLQQSRQTAPPPAPPGPDPVDQEAVEYAKDFDLYDAAGQPDVARARRIMARNATIAQRQAQQLVEPFQQQQLQAQAAQNYHFLLNLKHQDGSQIDPRVVDFVWQKAMAEPDGLKTLANQQSVASIALMAIGADAMWKKQQPATTPAAPPPVYTEASGGLPQTRPAISRLEERVARERGVSATQWSDTLKGFKPGQTNVLED
jgi:hypothetical protein